MLAILVIGKGQGPGAAKALVESRGNTCGGDRGGEGEG